jgi:hypothetical protein
VLSCKTGNSAVVLSCKTGNSVVVLSCKTGNSVVVLFCKTGSSVIVLSCETGISVVVLSCSQSLSILTVRISLTSPECPGVLTATSKQTRVLQPSFRSPGTNRTYCRLGGRNCARVFQMKFCGPGYEGRGNKGLEKTT